jgi:hypothetical protein
MYNTTRQRRYKQYGYKLNGLRRKSSKAQTKKETQEYATKMTLIGLFLAIFVALTTRGPLKQQNNKNGPRVGPFDLALLGISTFRLGRLAAFDTVADPLRKPFTKVEEDEYGAGDTVIPVEEGWRKALGELISCPICAGTWMAAGLVYGLHLLPGPTRIFMMIMGSIGLAEILNSFTEALSWSGQAARKLAGIKNNGSEE